MKRQNVAKGLNKKLKEAFLYTKKEGKNIEIINLDYSVLISFDCSALERAASLVENIVYSLGLTCKAKYNFSYQFVFSLIREFLVFKIGLSITEKGAKYDFYHLVKTDLVKLRPSKEHSLFVVLHGYNLPCNRSKVIEILEEVGTKEKLNLKIGLDDNTKEPIILFPETLYSFEIPLEARALEYVI